MNKANVSPSEIFVRKALEIAEKRPEKTDMLQYARFLIQCTLPHSDPGDVSHWTRKNGPWTLVIQPGWDARNNRPLGIPYGSVPRLLMAWIATEAKRTKRRKLRLGDGLNDFMRQIGMDPSHGGKKSDVVRLRDGMSRLFGARIINTMREELLGGVLERVCTDEMIIANRSDITWMMNAEQLPAFGSWIELSEPFYNAIMDSTIPCDLRAVLLLKKSPLALDLYMFCNWKAATLKGPKTVTWGQFAQQLGLDYADTRDIRRAIKAAMRKVQLAHPKLKFTYSEGRSKAGITIHPSEPAIPRTFPEDEKEAV